MHTLTWVGSEFKISSDVLSRTGLNMEEERQRKPAQTYERGKTGWKENSKCDLAFLTWGEGKEGEARKREGGRGKGKVGGGGGGGGWQERKFNLAPDSISKPRLTANHTHTCAHTRRHTHTHKASISAASGTEVLLVTSHHPELDQIFALYPCSLGPAQRQIPR